MDPAKRSTAQQMLQHPWVRDVDTQHSANNGSNDTPQRKASTINEYEQRDISNNSNNNSDSNLPSPPPRTSFKASKNADDVLISHQHHHHHAPPVTTASGNSAAATKPLHKGGHVKQQQHVHHNAVPTTRDYLAKLNTTIDFSSDKDSSPTKDTSDITVANCNDSGSGSGCTNANNTTPSPTGGIRGRVLHLLNQVHALQVLVCDQSNCCCAMYSKITHKVAMLALSKQEAASSSRTISRHYGHALILCLSVLAYDNNTAPAAACSHCPS
eukprot:5606-Heterococcus_DN1.PRE.3